MHPRTHGHGPPWQSFLGSTVNFHSTRALAPMPAPSLSQTALAPISMMWHRPRPRSLALSSPHPPAQARQRGPCVRAPTAAPQPR